MLLYLRDPAQFGVCINATMRGLAMATGELPFRADSRASYERFCQSLREWRERHDIAPQEADAVLAALWGNARKKDKKAPPQLNSATRRCGFSQTSPRTTMVNGCGPTATATKPSCGSRSSPCSNRSRRDTCRNSTRS